MTEIEKVSVEFEARVAEAIAKIEELKAAIRSIGNDRNSIVRITDGGSGRRTADNARRDMRRAGDDVQRDWRSVFRRIMQDNDNAFGRMTRTARRDGERAGRNYGDGFHRGLGLAPGGRRADWGKLIGMTMPAIAPAMAGLALPLAGAFEALLPALFSTVAIAPFVVSAFGKIQKAANTLETQQDKFNAAAGRTAISLKNNKQAAIDYRHLLDGLLPAEREAVTLLGKQGVSWDSLTAKQKSGVVQLREDTEAYKALAPAQKEALNALIAERAAWVNLDPQQAKALKNYQRMGDTFDILKKKLEPTMFRVLADAEQAAIDAMEPLYPVLHQVALGFDDLFVGLDRWFKSADYQRFIDMWSGDARRNIDSVGGAIGRIVLGLIHMYEAMHPLMGPTEDWLDRVTKRFANWPTSPKGQVQFQHFMQDVTTQGPLVWGTLKNITQAFDKVIAALAGNPLPWMILKDISAVFKWIASAPGGKVAINIIAWAFAIDRLAKALKSLAIYQGLLGLLGRGGVGRVAAPAAGGAAAAGTTRVLSPAAIRAGAGGAAGSAGAWGAVANPVGATLALTAGGVALAFAITHWADGIRKKSDAAAGVVRGSGDTFSAAASVGGVKVSKAYRKLADSYGTQVRDYETQMSAHAATVTKGGRTFRADSKELAEAIKSGNKAVKDVMYLGRTQFGQEAGLFVKNFGGNVAAMGASLRKQGKTLNQAMLDTQHQVFMSFAAQNVASWQYWKASTAKASSEAYAHQRKTTKEDITALNRAVIKMTDDSFTGRKGNEKKDFDAFNRAVKTFMDHSLKGQTDTANVNVKKLGKDISAYLVAMSKGDSVAASKAISAMQKDISGYFSRAADKTGKAAKASMDAQVRFIQGEIASINQKLPKLGSGQVLHSRSAKNRARGGPIDGPGHDTSDNIPIWASPGEYMVNAKSTRKHRGLLEQINADRYANGGVVGVAGEGAYGSGLAGMSGPVRSLGSVEKRLAASYSAAVAAIAAAAAAAAATGIGGIAVGGSGVTRWSGTVRSVLAKLHAPASALNAVLTRIRMESGGNPRAINLWDSNAKAGHPSKGLMQTIQGTFNAYAGPYRGRGIYDPFANIYAGVNYAMHRYGRNWIRVMTRPGGYDEGGWMPPGMSAVMNRTRKPEAVLNDAQWRAISRLAARGAGGVTVPIVVTLDGRKIYEAVRTRGWQAQGRNGRDMWSLTR